MTETDGLDEKHVIPCEVAGIRTYSPHWVYDKSGDKENRTKHNEEEVTQALILGIVGQLGSLLEKKSKQIKH